MKIKDKFRKLIEYDPDRELAGKAEIEMNLLREEMKKPEPDGQKIFELMCGKKYNKLMS